jgi:signal transduction histidine kinase
MLINFISNAIKFTRPNSTVEVILDAQLLKPTKRNSAVEECKKINEDRSEFVYSITGGHTDSFFETAEIKEQMALSDDLHKVEFSIEIKDQGEGISKEGINNLFLDFSRLKENQEHNQRGTGLGLSICKQIINKMGGSVNV